MTITSAMNAALTGLRAAARGSELVSNNIANATTEAYARRSLSLSAQTVDAGGVRIGGINRHVNEGLLADRRTAEAGHINAQIRADFLTGIEDRIGLAGEATGMSGRMVAFESGLIDAASRPDAIERLAGSVNDARMLSESFNAASDAVQRARSSADQQIASDVKALNRGLTQVQSLNAQIKTGQAHSGHTASLIDERDRVINAISDIVPMRVLQRDNGNVALYSEGGAILLDPTAVEIDFAAKNVVTPFQTIDNGTLSGLTLNAEPLRVSALSGGSLSANFEVRDDLGIKAQQKLDALARDLIERFQDPSVDPTLAVGDAGLFTDSGASFDPLNEVGLASRLKVNTAVDPREGGEVWRLRDGLNATTEGAAGDARLITALQSAMTDPRSPASGGFGTAARGAADHLSQFSGTLAADRDSAEQTLSYAAARLSSVRELQYADGVDTDQELQTLLILEKAYAANARVIQAADDMLETLVRL